MATKIRLYTQSINPFTSKVELALALKGLAYEREVSNDPEDIRRWSPVTRLLPVLQIDGDRIHDSTAIIRALEERFPDPPLVAREPKTARSQWRLAEWSDSSFLFYWDRWREARFPRPGDNQPVDASLLGKLRDGIARAFRTPGDGLSRRQLREAEVLNELAGRLGDLSAFLGQRPFFYADEPSVADISVYGMLRILDEGPITGAHDLIAERPELVEYMQRMRTKVASHASHPALDLPQAEMTAGSP